MGWTMANDWATLTPLTNRVATSSKKHDTRMANSHACQCLLMLACILYQNMHHHVAPNSQDICHILKPQSLCYQKNMREKAANNKPQMLCSLCNQTKTTCTLLPSTLWQIGNLIQEQPRLEEHAAMTPHRHAPWRTALARLVGIEKRITP